MTLLELADKVPPCLCRLLARTKNGRKALSHRDLAKITGLGKTAIATLSQKPTWRGQRIEVVVAFASACGVDLFNSGKVKAYLKEKNQVHIARASKNQKKMFVRIFNQEPCSGRGQPPQPLASRQ